LKSDGENFTKFLNELLDQMAKTVFRSQAAVRIFLFIYRKTAGWNKIWDGISRRQFIVGTGIKYARDIQKELDVLEWQNLIERRSKGQGSRTEYRIQKDVTKWRSWNPEKYKNLSETSRQGTQKKLSKDTISKERAHTPAES